jgi:hypothetical protein
MSYSTKSTIINVGIFNSLAIILMSFRLAMRKIRSQTFKLSDYLTSFAIMCIIILSPLIILVLLWGNNNMENVDRETHILTKMDIYRREVGSKMTLVCRTIYFT